jgi:hypothetical protein
MEAGLLKQSGTKKVVSTLGKLTGHEALGLIIKAREIGRNRKRKTEISEKEVNDNIELLYSLIIAIIKSRKS